MKSTTCIATSTLLLVALSAGPASAPHLSPPLTKQDRDGAPAQSLTAAELATLADPLFNLVLRDHSDAVNLAAIEQMIQPDRTMRNTFVVDERIIDPSKAGVRRAVISFSGSHPNGEILTANVMLSVFFDSTGFAAEPAFIEAWGWDNQRGRYNFYKLDRSGTPDGRPTWKFRTSSVDADLLSPTDRTGTCLACHINGAPIMKELAIPWNNWHSFESNATYLLPTSDPSSRWPASSDEHIKDNRLKGAESLETDAIIPAIKQFNIRRLNASLKRRDVDGAIDVDAEGRSELHQAKRLFRHLFVTTEFNIVSSRQKSGLHPFPQVGNGPAADVVVPNTFFLNANLLAGGTPARYLGLGIAEAQGFDDFAIIHPAEYKKLVNDSRIQLGRRLGDADFAWFVPEASHIDIDMVDLLMRRGVVTPEFVAAALAVDVENPVLSLGREELLQFVPDVFRFKTLASDANPLTPSRHPDELTRSVIAAIQAQNPAPGSAARMFMEGLQSADPIDRLRSAVVTYRDRVKAKLGGPDRQAELDRLFQQLLNRRSAVLNHEVLSVINETGDRLFPLP